MKKKNIIVIIIILIACALFYIIQPKSGSFNDLILSQYQSKNFTEISIVYSSEAPQPDEFRCKDKNEINELFSYLETLKLVEYKGSINYNQLGDEYSIYITNEVYNSDGFLHAKEPLGLTIYSNKLNFILVTDGYSTKTYKILNGKFDIKYLQKIMKTNKTPLTGVFICETA